MMEAIEFKEELAEGWPSNRPSRVVQAILYGWCLFSVRQFVEKKR